MNEMQVFDSEQFGEIRTVRKDGEPWFVAADVCRALELMNVTKAISRLEEDERSNFRLGRQGEVNVINEPGLYSLIFRSNKPEARAFKRWITHEVLPSIRRTGAYGAGLGAEASEALTMALRDAQAENERLRGLLAQRARRAEIPAPRPRADGLTEARRFVDALAGLLADGGARVCAADAFPDDSAGGTLIGFEDDNYLYLMPQICFDAVALRIRSAGQRAGDLRTVYRGLRALGLLVPDEHSGTSTRVKWVNGGTMRMLWLSRRQMNEGSEQNDL